MINNLNQYDWRSQPGWDEVKDNELIRAFNKLSVSSLQWIHLVTHHYEGGGYIPEDMDRETVHDVCAYLLDQRQQPHSPEFPYDEKTWSYPEVPWTDRIQ